MKEKSELLELYDDCLDFWDIERQVRMTQEECAELIVALSHLLRNRPGAKEKLIEELADVKLMTSQIIRYVGEEEVNDMIDFKSDRVKRKLKEAKEKVNGI